MEGKRTAMKAVGRCLLFSPRARYTLLELKFASTYAPSSPDQVLAPSLSFPIELTSVVNQTAPLSNHGVAEFSGIWSSSFSVNSDELFSNETRYSFFYRTQTNVSVSISQSIFYVSNLQEPIARQTEVIFRSLLFTIVVLEVFGLLFLVVKLLLVPLLRTSTACLIKHRARKNQVEPIENEMNTVVSDRMCLKAVKQAWTAWKPFRK
jgi:F0F1-type ATP synthase membrane subunit c/vacuolar-type H+-ATPase subunit K